MVKISSVRKGSPAYNAGIAGGDILVSLNGNEISDALDYYFYCNEKKLSAVVLRDGQQLSFTVKNPYEGETGMQFDTFLMDKKRCCSNRCIFCFIDQNPCGMRETIYFKDDDERLSFFQGSYVTLTNLRQKDIDRIIKMRISPINISVHTMNPELRVRMLGNRFAGEVLKYIDDISASGLKINAQIVLCKGWNDGDELIFTLNELLKRDGVESIAIVPCGLTKHRDGLEPLELFNKAESGAVIDTVEAIAADRFDRLGRHVCFCSDEFYLNAGRDLPPDEYYDGYPQLDNGVGMLRNHESEFKFALENTDECVYNRSIGIITGVAAAEHIGALCRMAKERFPLLDTEVFAVRNYFYGETVTVSGLVTGGDIIKQVGGNKKDLFLIPRNMLRADGDLFLDGVSLHQLQESLGARVCTVEADGGDLCRLLTEED